MLHGDRVGLVERGRELAIFGELLTACRARRGRLLVVEGAAGAGKSALLLGLREEAAAGGFRILQARGSRFEEGFPFGIVRQLFEPFLAAASAEQRAAIWSGAAELSAPLFDYAGGLLSPGAADDGEGAGRRQALFHGLYWLCVNVAEREPLLVVVDDVQWGDEASLRFLHYLATRLDELPVVVAVATESVRWGAQADVVRAMSSSPLTRVMRAEPLTETGVRELVVRVVGADQGTGFARLCHEATGGNPFFLRELLGELQADGVVPTGRPATPAAAGAAKAAEPAAPAEGDPVRALSRVGDGRCVSVPVDARRGAVEAMSFGRAVEARSVRAAESGFGGSDRPPGTLVEVGSAARTEGGGAGAHGASFVARVGAAFPPARPGGAASAFAGPAADEVCAAIDPLRPGRAAGGRDEAGGAPVRCGDVVARVSRLAPGSVSRSVVRRLRLSPGPVAVFAEAMAVLGLSADPVLVGQVAGLSRAEATEAVGVLVELGMVQAGSPLRFVQPIVRETLYRDLPPRLRHRTHVRAAKALTGGAGTLRGEAAGEAADHLMEVPPAGDAWVAEVLAVAGRSALAHGDPGTAVRYLRRALHEPAPAGAVPALSAALGRAELRARGGQACRRLALALDAAPGPEARARVGVDLAAALVAACRHDEALTLLQELREELAAELPTDGSDPAGEGFLRVCMALTVIAQLMPATRHVAARELAGLAEWAGEHQCDDSATNPVPTTRWGPDCVCADIRRVLTSADTVLALSDGTPAQQVVDRVQHALDRGCFAYGRLVTGPDGELHPILMLAAVLAHCGRLTEADTLLTRILADARDQNLTLAADAARATRAWVRLQRGMSTEAEADARTALRVIHPDAAADAPPPPGSVLCLATAALAATLAVRGDLPGAAALLAHAPDLDTPQTLTLLPLLVIRGQVRLAQGQSENALDDILHARAQFHRWTAPTPAAFLPTIDAVAALVRLGRTDEARALASAQLPAGRAFGAPRTIAGALRASASTARDTERVALLEEALQYVRTTPAVLDHASTLIELGVAHRLNDQRMQARCRLREAIDLAEGCGATALVKRAQEELDAITTRTRTGRPRRTGQSGLTPQERRVADLAASGYRNQEIAHTLFVTVKTVEWHLSQVYRKLGINSRAELADSLETGGTETA
ncbi:AAA family ATPase [Embleya sp. AB8]|uniref:helix-turn-helix transcriptional regulator n=1 Tax=Embleya sp. AB8 TaxID=3156304 RepID=UPI003C73C530